MKGVKTFEDFLNESLDSDKELLQQLMDIQLGEDDFLDIDLDIEDEDGPLIAHLWGVIRKVAEQSGLEKGYRVVVNCGNDGGQEVDHLHYHLLGGRALKWPPG